MLFEGDYDGIVLRPRLAGITLLHETSDYVDLRVGAGVQWDTFVEYAVQRGYGGVENLSGVPGTVGAAPVQNIGAYGVEAGSCISRVEALQISTGKNLQLSREQCHFGYRDSVFKHELKRDAVITYVSFRLAKHPVVNTSYGPVREALLKVGDSSVSNVRHVILSIRESKLPAPDELGNAGSFFKNPEVSASKHASLLEQYPTLPAFSLPGGNFKVPAAWLIEQCGWKGKSMGMAGVHENQPLVLVNRGGASACDILALAYSIIRDVKAKFGIELRMEVNIVRS